MRGHGQPPGRGALTRGALQADGAETAAARSRAPPSPDPGSWMTQATGAARRPWADPTPPGHRPSQAAPWRRPQLRRRHCGQQRAFHRATSPCCHCLPPTECLARQSPGDFWPGQRAAGWRSPGPLWRLQQWLLSRRCDAFWGGAPPPAHCHRHHPAPPTWTSRTAEWWGLHCPRRLNRCRCWAEGVQLLLGAAHPCPPP
mmetsp:Transcript_11406/g.34293  ORF Transcript_11406/g.34293 Transcript_11406/m.34293 type:complete len:200 (-) Transcript_11406:1167-1766(-)